MIKFFFDSQDFGYSFLMRIVDVDSNGEVRRIAKPVTIEWGELHPRDGAIVPPTIELFPVRRQDIKQALQDGLDDYDIMHGKMRSVDMVKGELNATKYHLEDMRTLADVKERKPLV